MNPMGSPRVSAFPNWLKVGSGAGLFFMVAAMVLPRLLRKADQLEAHGNTERPTTSP